MRKRCEEGPGNLRQGLGLHFEGNGKSQKNFKQKRLTRK